MASNVISPHPSPWNLVSTSSVCSIAMYLQGRTFALVLCRVTSLTVTKAVHTETVKFEHKDVKDDVILFQDMLFNSVSLLKMLKIAFLNVLYIQTALLI